MLISTGVSLPAMRSSLLLLAVTVVVQLTHGSMLRVWRKPAIPLTEGDPGEPLLLTPFIDSGNVTGGQAAAAVQPLAGTVRSYAGYLTVNKEYGSNMFFWFFPAEQNPDEAAVVLWLQGGPGATSLYGLFTENGPYVMVGGKVSLREHSWSKQYNLLYIDNPVGTGYSFTGSDEGYARDETRVGQDLYHAVLQFFQLFPQLQGREFFITGESYAGKYIPALGHAIHNENPGASLKINLQGLLIGNGFCDPEHMMDYGDYLFELGLVDAQGRDELNVYKQRIVSNIQQKKWMEAFQDIDEMLLGDLTSSPTLFQNLTGFNFYFNYLHTEDYTGDDGSEVLQQTDVRRALHVGNAKWHSGSKVEDFMREDMPQSVAPWVAELLDHYRVIISNGQLDIIVAYPLSDNFLRSLSWSMAEEFSRAPRTMWRVGNDVAGYAKTAGRLTQVLVRNAGHMVPQDQPEWALDMLHRLVTNQTFGEPIEPNPSVPAGAALNGILPAWCYLLVVVVFSTCSSVQN